MSDTTTTQWQASTVPDAVMKLLADQQDQQRSVRWAFFARPDGYPPIEATMSPAQVREVLDGPGGLLDRPGRWALCILDFGDAIHAVILARPDQLDDGRGRVTYEDYRLPQMSGPPVRCGS